MANKNLPIWEWGSKEWGLIGSIKAIPPIIWLKLVALHETMGIFKQSRQMSILRTASAGVREAY